MHKSRILKAATAKLIGDRDVALANAHIYLESAQAIGEHSDIVESFLNEIEKAAHAQDKLDMINQIIESDLS